MITPEQLSNSGSESGHQKAFFCWINQNLDKYPELKWIHAISNGFFATPGQKAKMKAEGLRSGVLDIFLPQPIISYDWVKESRFAGLYIEMKHQKYRTHKNGGLSDEQKEFIDFATAQGYKCEVCYTWIEARDAVLKYLGRM